MTKENESFDRIREFSRWKPAAWLRVSGEDAAAFLQGQLTNDLRDLERAPTVYGLWLNQKGKVLADSFVLRSADGIYWVGSYASAASVIRERLEAYIIADDVVVEDATTEWSGVTWFGHAPEQAPTGVLVFPGRRAAAGATEWVFREAERGQVEAALSRAHEIDAEEVARRRIAAGIPAVPADIGPGDLPNEGGLETEAISYTKGCYLGQEVMARLKTMGQVRRRLRRVRGSGALPSVPAELIQGGRKVGELRSVAREADGFVGLAMLTLMSFQAETPLTFSAAGVERELRTIES